MNIVDRRTRGISENLAADQQRMRRKVKKYPKNKFVSMAIVEADPDEAISTAEEEELKLGVESKEPVRISSRIRK